LRRDSEPGAAPISIAEERAEGLADGERALTAAGRRRTTETLRRAVALDLRVERLISSPLLRARQTDGLAVAAGLAPTLELATALAPGGDPRPLLDTWLAATTSPGAGAVPRSLALVGHEPDLGQLASSLLGAPAGTITLRKAGIVLIRLGVAGARLEALIGPRLLRLRQPSHRSP